MRHLIIIAIFVTAVLLISGCAGQPAQTSPGAQAPSQEPVKTLGQQTQQLAPDEEYLGKTDSNLISLKQFSGKAGNIATAKYPDACLISILGEYVSSKELGKAQIWSYKYYSKSQNKALTVAVQTKATASGVDVYAKTTDNVVVFKDEPYKKCVTLANDVDSDYAAQTSGGFSGPVTISLENNPENQQDEYTFSDGTRESKVTAEPAA